MTTHLHDSRAPLRQFPGHTGVYLRAYGAWVRPLRVWLYRGAWRVVCRACKPAYIGSGDVLHDDGWPTMESAYGAALQHCAGCHEAGARPIEGGGMNRRPFWSDNFDTDLLKVIPRAADILDQVTAPLWTYGATTHGRLNHPSVWGGQAFFGSDDGGTWKPDSFVSDGQLVQCTWTEAARDAWVHTYIIVVDYEPIWDATRLAGTFTKLMYDLRGITKLPAGDADRLRGQVLASLIAATADLQNLTGAVA